MPPDHRHKKLMLILASGIIFLLLVFSIAPPYRFPKGAIVEVPSGISLSALSDKFAKERLVSSSLSFRALVELIGGERRLKAGSYYFARPQSALEIAWRVRQGDYRIETVKVTIPEGFTVRKISALFDERFLLFDNKAFEAAAPEGYLFPDTYFLPITATASSTIKLLRDNFVRKIFPVMPEVELSGKTLEEILIMASLIEGEVNNQPDREMVSDVLWKRLKLGMPLQVDVEMKTYEFAGLPEGPINNPGLLSIEAALHPTTTPYLYYLTGDDGKMYYSKTFDEHVEKKQKYIR